MRFAAAAEKLRGVQVKSPDYEWPHESLPVYSLLMRLILWFAAACAIGSYLCGPISDPDLWWHITVGRWIIANQEIPTVDHWNMWGAGRPWRAYSWAPEILAAWIDAWWGIHGLYLLKVVLGVSFAGSVLWMCGRIARDYTFGVLIGALAVTACFSHFTLRPQSFIWILFALLIERVDRVFHTELTRRDLFFVAFLMMLWSNTHLTAVLGLLVIALWGVSSPSLHKNRTALWLLLSGFIGTLCTPYFGGEWITLLSKASHPFQHRAIAEFRAATLFDYTAGFLILLSVLFFLFLHYQPRFIRAGQLVLATVSILLGAAIIKFIPFAAIVLAALLGVFWRNRQEQMTFGAIGEGILRLSNLVSRIPREGLAFLLFVFMILNIHKGWRAPLNTQFVPKDAVDFIQAHNLPTPVLSTFGDGGYLMYRYSDSRGNPEFLVPIDGRTNVTDPAVLKLHQKALRGYQSWRAYIERTKPGTILWRNEGALVAILLEREEWCLVYQRGTEEGGHSVFVRRELFNTRAAELQSSNCSVERAATSS